MTKLLLVSRGIFRPGLRARRALRDILLRVVFEKRESGGEVELEETADTARLGRLRVEEAACVVLHFAGRQPVDGIAGALDAFMLEGGAVVAIEPSIAACGFATPHEPIAAFQCPIVSPTQEFSRVFEDIKPFQTRETVVAYAPESIGGAETQFAVGVAESDSNQGELYAETGDETADDTSDAPHEPPAGLPRESAAVPTAEAVETVEGSAEPVEPAKNAGVPARSLDASAHVQFPATGTDRFPVVWTRYRGKGRLCCIAFGSTAATVRVPEVGTLIDQALSWALTPPNHALPHEPESHPSVS